MCLDTVKNTSKKKAGTGFKILFEFDGILTSHIAMKTVEFTVGEWKTDPNLFYDDPLNPAIKNRKHLHTDWKQPYPTGFHIFKTFREAKEWWDSNLWGYSERMNRCVRFCKVEYKNECARGYQEGHEVIVAEDMKVLSVRQRRD